MKDTGIRRVDLAEGLKYFAHMKNLAAGKAEVPPAKWICQGISSHRLQVVNILFVYHL
jgi:hypothetical protein